jgi:hypothetical protein
MPDHLLVLPTDLTWVRVNGGRGFAYISNWDSDAAPVVGQHVVAADGGTERLEAEIVDIRNDGVLVLEFPDFVPSRHADLEVARVGPFA